MDAARRTATPPDLGPEFWIERIALTNFRNYRTATVEPGPRPVVLLGANGAGKTNMLEAVSLIAPGQGLRRAAYETVARQGGAGDWAVAARVRVAGSVVEIGTGLDARLGDARAGRIVRIDGASKGGSGALADVIEMVWLTPAMDGLLTGPAADRRRFLDRLILCFDPGYRTRLGHFERAMRQRNRLLEQGATQHGQLGGLERIMAETGVAIAAMRAEAVAQIQATILARRDRDPLSPFPWSKLALDGDLDLAVARMPAVEAEDHYADRLAAGRERDRGAGRTLDGPHRSDLIVHHGPKSMPANLCSTGEQKALLVGLILAHAERAAERRDGAVPILLLDEIAAHLDPSRRAALFEELLHLRTQAWMTGTDAALFDSLEGRALLLKVEDGTIAPFLPS
ncbi:MAG: DNA replication/repair protein RecF [Hyphomicrobiaceae bacterium]